MDEQSFERTPEDEIVAAYRAAKPGVCVVCKYSLDGVPMSAHRAVTCPECGFVTQFRVRVEMVAYRDPKSHEERVRVKRAARTDRTLVAMAVVVFLVVVIWIIRILVGVL